MVNIDLGKPALSASQAMRKYFPNMTLIEARALGQKIDPVLMNTGTNVSRGKEQGGGGSSDGMGGLGVGLGIGLGGMALLYYFMKR